MHFTASVLRCSVCVAASLWVASAALWGGTLSGSEPVIGFTEPYRTIRVSAAESGIVTQLLVNEGDYVQAGQPLAVLDQEVFQSQLQVAEHQAQTVGRLRIAQAELSLHQRRLDKLLELEASGEAYAEEVARSRADKEIAEGRLQVEQEDNHLAQLQLERARLALNRRTITAPFAGYVAEVAKNLGEALSGSDPHLLTLVELDPLRAVFLLTREQASQLQPHQAVKLQLARTKEQLGAQVEFISAVNHAESGMVTVKLRIENPQRRIHGGERCLLPLPETRSLEQHRR